MYSPREDSELLANVVKKYAKGSALDIGAGSGILSEEAKNVGCKVLAVDIDSKVVLNLKKKFRAKKSNMFSTVHGKFDTIICNPPYLPQEKDDDDVALYGGKKGYEYIVKLIEKAKNHLEQNGQFLFLISSLTKPSVVEKALVQNAYNFEIVAREKLFMEELFVYRATLAIGEPAVLLGKGARGIVYGTKKYAVKVTTSSRALKESKLLACANKVGVGPRFIRVSGDRLYMQKVSGIPFNEYVRKTRDIKVMRKLLTQARALDKIELEKKELSRPGANVLVTSTKKIVLLDFERSIFSPKPGNVTQVASFVSRMINRNIETELKAYKKSYTEKNYRALIYVLFS